ncbi:MAG TPA: C1 family peptidase [Candidatus Saccharimonadia bacterium]|nr:C1 family peptidase [Candidatus Saccharimonadia bacterium]
MALVTPRGHGLGNIPDPRDPRDHKFDRAGLDIRPSQLPNSIDLRPDCPDVYDQGQLGSCTANALAAAYDMERRRQGQEPIGPSRLFIYYNERAREGTVDTDAGAYLRDGMKVLAKLGVPPESEWLYDISRFTVKPSAQCYADALSNQVLSYARIKVTSDDTNMRSCLAAGRPFVAGIAVYASFESDEANRTGVIPVPKPNEELLGGHAILVVGYDMAAGYFICRNSWGKRWGDAGYFYLPLAYLTDRELTSDLWTIKLVEA